MLYCVYYYTVKPCLLCDSVLFPWQTPGATTLTQFQNNNIIKDRAIALGSKVKREEKKKGQCLRITAPQSLQ